MRDQWMRFLATVLLVCTAAPSQNVRTAPQNVPVHKSPSGQVLITESPKVFSSRFLLQQAHYLTDEAEADRKELDANSTTMLGARLASIWWRTDQDKAKAWLSDSVVAVTRNSSNEQPQDRETRITVALAVLRVASALDKATAQILVEFLTKEAEATADNRLKDRLAAAFGTVATQQYFQGNIEASADLVRAALRSGNATQAANLIASVGGKHPDLAGNLYVEALSAAQRGSDPRLISVLGDDAFPRNSTATPGITTAMQQQFLQLLASIILRVPQSANDRNEPCGYGPEALRLGDKFDPDTAAAIRSVLSTCDAKQMKDATTADACQGVVAQQCLSAAELETDPLSRAQLKQKAASLAIRDEGDSAYALQILQNMSEEERSNLADYNSQLEHVWSEAAKGKLQNGDRNGFYDLIAKADRSFKPALELRFAKIMIEGDQKEEGLNLLSRARDDLSTMTPVAHSDLTELINLYATYIPSEAEHVLGEAVDAINRTSRSEKTKRREIPLGSSRPSFDLLEPLTFSTRVLALNSSFLSATLNRIDSVQLRERFRLAIISDAVRMADRKSTYNPARPKAAPSSRFSSKSKPQ